MRELFKFLLCKTAHRNLEEDKILKDEIWERTFVQRRAEERGGEERKRRSTWWSASKSKVLRRPVLCPLFPGRAVL